MSYAPLQVAPRPAALRLALSSVLVIALAGCSAAPDGRARAEPPAPAGGAAAVSTAPEGAAATRAPAARLATQAPSPAEPADVGGCAVPEQSFTPPSIRLENVRVTSGAGGDRIVFVFGPGDPPEELATIGAAQPPFFEGQSTNEVDVAGDRWIRILFRDMLQPAAAGEEVFVGPRDLRPGLAAVQQLVSTDESEAVHEWIAGYVGDGCVSLHVSEKDGTVTVEIEHGT